MNKKLLVAAIACGLALAASSPDCLAQSPITRPKLSPYLGLFRRPTGVLPNYQTFVQPRLQLEQAYLQQQQVNQAISKRLQEIQTPREAVTGVQSRFNDKATYFRNYGQFFRTHLR